MQASDDMKLTSPKMKQKIFLSPSLTERLKHVIKTLAAVKNQAATFRSANIKNPSICISSKVQDHRDFFAAVSQLSYI